MNRVILYTTATLLLAIITARSSAQEISDTKQLQEVIVTGGNQRALSSSRGIRILGAVSLLTPDKVGYEVGTALSVKHPFELEEIEFDIIANSIRDVTLRIAIYSDSTFAEMLSHPIIVNIPEGKRQRTVATPTESTLLAPGDYVVSITLASCDEETQQQWINCDQWDGQTRYQMMKKNIQFPLYTKAGYIRSSATDTFEKCPTNIGLKVRGWLKKK